MKFGSRAIRPFSSGMENATLRVAPRLLHSAFLGMHRVAAGTSQKISGEQR